MIRRIIQIDEEKCNGCGLCAKACSYGAIIDRKRPCEKACKVGAISMAETGEAHINEDKCISCGACVKKCEKKSVGALTMQNYRPIRDAHKCIGCGECVINCPNRAWTRSEQKYYRLTLLGRTGKKNPRMGEDFIKWVDEETIIKIILNTYDYVKEYIDPNAPGGKEHIGYIVDRTGFEEFKRWALKDVVLPEKAEVITPVYWKGIKY